MRAFASCLILCLAGAATAAGPAKVTKSSEESGLLEFDLRSVPGRRVLFARLRLGRDELTGIDEDVLAEPKVVPPLSAAGGPKADPQPLRLVGPWYQWLDATAAVQAARSGE